MTVFLGYGKEGTDQEGRVFHIEWAGKNGGIFKSKIPVGLFRLKIIRRSGKQNFRNMAEVLRIVKIQNHHGNGFLREDLIPGSGLENNERTRYQWMADPVHCQERAAFRRIQKPTVICFGWAAFADKTHLVCEANVRITRYKIQIDRPQKKNHVYCYYTWLCKKHNRKFDFCMKVISACTSRPVYAFLGQRRSGKVLLVTSKGIYTQLDGQILLWCPDDWGLVPLGISIKEYAALRDCGLRAGQCVTWDGSVLRGCGNAVGVRIEAREQKPVLAKPDARAVELCMRQLSRTGKTTGLVPLLCLLLDGVELSWNLYCQTAAPAVRQLMRLGDVPDELEEAVRALLGLGVGLTPSGDDFLCGFLYFLLRSGWKQSPAVFRLTELILQNAPERTNQISAAFLRSVAKGADCERMDQMVKILGGTGEASIRCMTEIGSSSGSEMLLGMLAACKQLLEYQEGRQ